ncbi:adenylate/guanylate cyclase domain-containing protein [Thermodesulfobacteriota bacterium]
MFNLTIIRPDGKEIDHEFSGDQAVVGRHESCDLCLVDNMVSRDHCLITREGQRFVIKDLGSQNGTWVNGRRVKNRRRIKRGDVIQVGPFRLFFLPDPVPNNAPESLTPTLDIRRTGPDKGDSDSFVRPLGNVGSYISETTEEYRRVPTKVRRERLNRNLLTIYRITEELVATTDLTQILDYIMDQIFEIFTPSQATILLKEKDGVPVPRKERCSGDTRAERSASNTIIRKILDDRVSILTEDALDDPRFDMVDTVIYHGIRSVMAAPIWEDRTILGVIYVDSVDVVGGYQPEDLDLLTAIGHQAALAIQRWELTEQLREEAVKSAVIRQNLGRFHSPQVVEHILEDAADLNARETSATIFFCDIVGFSALCESTTPDMLQVLLNLFFKTVTQEVFREQGTLDKFIGDAAMAIFGAPLAQADAPARAVRAAVRIRDKLEQAMPALPTHLQFQVRYGINTGQAIVGNFGSDERIDYTIFGHAVNLASRICHGALPDRIVVGPQTWEGLKDNGQFVIKPLGRRKLKGLTTQIELFDVGGFTEPD